MIIVVILGFLIFYLGIDFLTINQFKGEWKCLYVGKEEYNLNIKYHKMILDNGDGNHSSFFLMTTFTTTTSSDGTKANASLIMLNKDDIFDSFDSLKYNKINNVENLYLSDFVCERKMK